MMNSFKGKLQSARSIITMLVDKESVCQLSCKTMINEMSVEILNDDIKIVKATA